jgi:hypothetical protein
LNAVGKGRLTKMGWKRGNGSGRGMERRKRVEEGGKWKESGEWKHGGDEKRDGEGKKERLVMGMERETGLEGGKA